MRNRIFFVGAVFSCLALGPFLPGTARAAEAPKAVTLQSDDLEIAEQSETTLSVNVPAVPKNADAVLEFTAWYPAPKHAGFYAAMRVLWDGEEMEDILDRPAEFEVREGPNTTRTIPVRRGKYWNVPVIPSPEASTEPTQAYYIPPDKVDVVRFRFRLPALAAGDHELTIRNNMRGNLNVGYDIFPVLMLREVVIRWVAK